MSNVRKFLVGFVTCLGLIGWVSVTNAGLKAVAPGIAGVFTSTGNGTATVPSYGWASVANTGMYTDGANVNFTVAGTLRVLMGSGQTVLADAYQFGWGDTILARDAANTLAQKNAANPQSHRWYFTTTGPVYQSITARASGAVLTGSGGAMQLSTAQTTVPTCSTNCGTSPSVVGTDTFMTVNMGATGVPASGWVVTFNGTWPAAPACVVQMAKAGMVVGKQALTAVTTTTTITVVTNGTAPGTADMYHIHCGGIS